MITLSPKFDDTVSKDHADLILLACYFVTGLLDSASISRWGSFVSMQTGNTVYIGLGFASNDDSARSSRLPRSAAALAAFCLGSFLFSRFHRRFVPRRRWVLCASFLVQLILCVGAALVVTLAPPPGKDADDDGGVRWNDMVPIVLAAFQSSGQAVASRALKYNSLTSVVLTSIYCDLFSDQDLFALTNVERNRRATAPVLLVAGAAVDGLLSASDVGISGALWTVSALKGCIVVSWMLWPREPETD